MRACGGVDCPKPSGSPARWTLVDLVNGGVRVESLVPKFTPLRANAVNDLPGASTSIWNISATLLVRVVDSRSPIL